MRMMRTVVCAAGWLLVLQWGGAAAASGQDGTDIFLAEVSLRDGRVAIGAPRNATQREGYDNQPWFLPDGSGFLYSSQRDGQMDIFRYDIAAGQSRQLTRTPENEYSPTLAADGRMMVVRWPTDMSTGALWWFTAEGVPVEEARGSAPRVGYYAFADEHTLALFINDSIQSFMLSDTRTGESVRIGQGMNGSAPRRIPGSTAVSFQQRREGVWWLMRLQPATRAVEPLVPMVGGVPNYTWTGHGSVLAATENIIWEWAPGWPEWRKLVEFDDPALQRMTRLALSPAGDRIAIVSARP
jgi:hypothetical protein